ncbi:hypothetical protein RFI_26560 [Reticulomyxa filosa]|uniref:Uncharacterized protein n=1 Tax=Reticulomyxa filosa TaxID=46433 RepID=X6MBH7_RETFI|nr:hypothetical protein RFI_26560 [Reticulomyxa filosa]|eukprot:ETO10817.1 hypothetical protein RFI_26560 [Reticulomyxa filosa]
MNIGFSQTLSPFIAVNSSATSLLVDIPEQSWEEIIGELKGQLKKGPLDTVRIVCILGNDSLEVLSEMLKELSRYAIKDVYLHLEGSHMEQGWVSMTQEQNQFINKVSELIDDQKTITKTEDFEHSNAKKNNDGDDENENKTNNHWYGLHLSFSCTKNSWMEGLYTKWLELVNIKYMQFCKQRQEKLSKWKSKSEESEDMYLNMSLTLASNAIESFNRLKEPWQCLENWLAYTNCIRCVEIKLQVPSFLAAM